MSKSDPSLRIKNLINTKIHSIKKTIQFDRPNADVHQNVVIRYFKGLESQLGLVLIIVFSLVMNLSIASAKNIDQTVNITSLNGMTPEAIAETVTSINKYTPSINTDKEKIVYAMVIQQDSNYISSSEQFSTNVTPPETEPEIPQKPRTQTINYTVIPGDTLSGIAAKFGLSVATLQYSNNLTNLDSLKLDQVLKIPSANLSATAIAKAQKNSKILAYGTRNTVGRDSYSNGSFIVPVAHHGISQGFSSYHHGIDYMCYVGTSVRASSSGTIIEADSFGWNYGWGKNILISHGNGITTRYAHLSQINVTIGERVSQGEIIGKSGNTGHSTGPHLHFQKEKYGTPIYPY